MAVLNPPSSLPGLARSMTNYLLESDAPLEEDRLIALFSPPGLAGDEAGSRGVDNTLVVGRAIGLFERTGDRHVFPSRAAVERADGQPYSKVAFRRLVRELVLNVERDGDPWDSAAGLRTSGARDLARALSWFLAQDASGPPLTWTADDRHSIQSLQSSQLRSVSKDDRAILNDTRWGAFTRWAPFLGLADQGYVQSVGIGLVPLPVVAMRDVLTELPSGGQPIAAVLQHLRKRLPVLHGGAYRRSLDSLLPDDPDPCVRRNGLDSSIAQPLFVLEDEGVLKLEQRADAERQLLLDEVERYVSHVVIASQEGAA
jgi:hypothetical protein